MVEKYLWANLTTLLAIYDKDDNLIQRFEYADGRMPTSMTSNNQKYYLHYDQVGTLKAVSNSNQKIIKKIVYDTYGNILFDSNPSFKVPFGFAGGLYDTDTKLTRFGYRDYDAYTGKWTAKDPIDFGGGDSNLYGYVLQDPVDFVDASGEFGWMIVGGLIGAGFEGLNQYKSGNFDWRRLVVAAGTGALGGVGTSIAKSLVVGAVTNMANNAYQQLDGQDKDPCPKDFSYKELGLNGFTGAGGAWIGGALGKFGAGTLRNPTQRGVRNLFPPSTRANVFPNAPTYENAASAVGAVAGGYIGNQ